MIVCIDTNVVLSIFTLSHAHHPILQAWQLGRFTWAVSTDILLEYDEVMLRQ
jgi:predicted nucleic acid-binding protein